MNGFLKFLTIGTVCSTIVKLACVFKGRENVPSEMHTTTITAETTNHDEEESKESDEVEEKE